MTGAALVPWLAARLVQTSPGDAPDPPWLDTAREVWSYIEPYKYFLLILIVFWYFARRSSPVKDDFDAQAQRVLEEKYRKGEISQKAYEKYRQDIALRPKR
jgi:hypothetical protein